MVRLKDIIAGLESIAPGHLAEEWDNVGLQVGHPEWPAERVLIALDPTPSVIEEAIQDGANVVVTHHPLLFRPLRQLNLATATGALVQKLIDKRVAVVAAHTNLDSVPGGINDVLVEMLALEKVTVLQPIASDTHAGLGRVGQLPQAVRFESLVRDIKTRLGLAHIRYAGQPADLVRGVAVCSGSGGSLLNLFLASSADVYVTGDVRYHEAREIEAQGRGIIDVGHFESERIIVGHLAQRLAAWLAQKGLAADVLEAQSEQTPFQTL